MVRTPCIVRLWSLLVGAAAALALATLGTHAALGGISLTKSAGCGLPAAQTGRIESKTWVAGRLRTYLLQLPLKYDPSRAYPLVFVFHGAGGDAMQSYSWGLQNAPGAADNGIFVFPNGIGFQHDGIGWDDGPDGHDLPFFDAMVKEIEVSRCIDTSQLFVAGFSWGGDFAVALACHRGSVLRGVAANSTNDEYRDSADFRTYRGLPCRSTQHPAVRFSHAVGGDKEYPAPDFATTSRLFQYLNGCTADSTPAPSSTPVMACRSFTACRSDYTECAFDTHIGHTLPPNWAPDTWDFFLRMSTARAAIG